LYPSCLDSTTTKNLLKILIFLAIFPPAGALYIVGLEGEIQGIEETK
jgi:hypothetical protein